MMDPQIPSETEGNDSNYGGFILLDPPPHGDYFFWADLKSRFGKSYYGDNHFAIKLPPGLHLIGYNNTKKVYSEYFGFFHRFKENEFLVKKWDAEEDRIDMTELSPEEIEKVTKDPEILEAMFPYLDKTRENWEKLTYCISDELLAKLVIPHRTGLIGYGYNMDDYEPTKGYPKDFDRVTDFNFTKIPDQAWLEDIIESYATYGKILGEWQLSYIFGVLLYISNSYNQWKRICQMFQKSMSLVVAHRNLYRSFFDILDIQMLCVEDQHFGTSLHMDSYLTKLIMDFFSQIAVVNDKSMFEKLKQTTLFVIGRHKATVKATKYYICRKCHARELDVEDCIGDLDEAAIERIKEVEAGVQREVLEVLNERDETSDEEETETDPIEYVITVVAPNPTKIVIKPVRIIDEGAKRDPLPRRRRMNVPSESTSDSQQDLPNLSSVESDMDVSNMPHSCFLSTTPESGGELADVSSMDSSDAHPVETIRVSSSLPPIYETSSTGSSESRSEAIDPLAPSPVGPTNGLTGGESSSDPQVDEDVVMKEPETDK